MYRGRTVGVVVPAYNEEDHVGTVLDTIPTFVDRIYAVDDRSTDSTWDIIQARASTSEHVEDDAPELEPNLSLADGGATAQQRIDPIRHDKNLGAGAALRTGYLHALDDRIDIAVAMDADGQMDPDQMSRLLDPIVEDRADYAKGNRLARRDDRQGMPSFRLFGNTLLSVLTKLSSGYWGIEDPQNGYTAISHGALARIGIAEMPDGHDYTNDLLVRLNAREMRVADVPMPAVYDDEDSTIRYRTFVPRTSKTLLRGFLQRLGTRFQRTRTDPVPYLYSTGMVCAALTLLAGFMAITGIGQSTGPSIVTILVVLLAATSLGAVLMDARAAAELEVVG